MRFLVRLLGGIWLATLVVSAGFAYLEVREERQRQMDALTRRATLVGSAVAEAAERLVTRGARTGYERVLTRFGTPDRGLAIYDAFGGVLGATVDVRPFLGPLSPLVSDAIHRNEPVAGFHNVGGRLTWVHVVPVQQEERAVGAAAVFLDAQYLDSGEWDLWRRTAVRMGVLMLLVTGITWALVRWSVTRPIARIAEWTKQMKAGHPVAPPPNADESLFGSLASEVTGLARTLARARSAAEQEARLRLAGESVWTEERLKQFVELRFGRRPVFVVSNREPVSHVRDGRVVREQEPASGLVTALGPIMQACGGVWVAHGSGNADREAVGICPWQSDILLGMLGADLVGFHTQFYCNNFLETVERAIEGRIEWDRFTVVRGQHTTHVRPFPISVAPDLGAAVRPADRAAALAAFGVTGEFIGVGVERVDYTKGLPERIRALRRFFERWPEYRRRLTFIQIASPSRSRIARYQAVQEETREMVRTLNADLGERGWQPIVYRERHHDRREIYGFYRLADFCMVTSLHDGMNLVAKEFVAARDEDDGVLILSRFAGASHELPDALLVNPYDVEDVAGAIHRAITLPVEECRDRMSRMRTQVREHNIYGWAGLLLDELARISRATDRRAA